MRSSSRRVALAEAHLKAARRLATAWVRARSVALRNVVASLIAGITIMFDRPFQVSDRVSYGGKYGDILNNWVAQRAAPSHVTEQLAVVHLSPYPTTPPARYPAATSCR